MRSVAVEGLVVRYGPVEAVRGASFGVEAGEVFGLLGPNGAGKTSVLRVLVTLLRPHAGRVWVLGHDVSREPRAVRRLIGYVPQAISADGSLTGRENVTLFARLYGLDGARGRARVEEVLELMGLREAAGEVVRAYSGGMVRRLEIASALVGSPRVLLLDEPTLGLDPGARRGVWEHLHREREATGMTVVVTTHYMEEAEQHCDRLAVMSAGRILAEAAPAELPAKVGKPGASLEDAFIALTGIRLEEDKGGLREVARARRTARRLG